MNIYMYTCIFICTYIYLHIHIYIYIYIRCLPIDIGFFYARLWIVCHMQSKDDCHVMFRPCMWVPFLAYIGLLTVKFKKRF